MKAISAPEVSWPECNQAGADAEHDGVGHPGQELHEGEVDRHQPLGRHPGLQVVAAEAVEALVRRVASWTKACDSRTPDRLSWKSALTIAMRSRDRS